MGTRRSFLTTAATGIAVVSVPRLFGCTPAAAVHRASPPPSPPTSAKSPAVAVPAGYFETFGVTYALLQRVVAKGLARGGDFCEVFLQHRINHWLGMEDGAVNRAYAKVDLGAGVRVLKGDATGYAFCEDLREDALMAAAATAAAVADGPAQVSPKALAAGTVASRYAISVPWSEVAVDKKLPIVQQAEAKAKAVDNRIVKVSVFLEDETSHVLVADSDGRLVEDEQPMTSLMVSCVATHKGRTETSGHSRAARDGASFYAPAAVDGLASEAAANTLMLFDAVSPPAGEYPVVLAPGLSGILLHEAIGHGMEADFNRKGISVYADRIGTRIAPPDVTIVDDGTNEKMRGSINIDDEGAASQRTVLVEKGMLRTYLHDRISARHFKVDRTASGRRESFRFPPVPRMRNTYMMPGPHKHEEIIASVKKGLYAEMFTNGQVQIGAGDFTFYLKHGRLIEDGKLTRVVKDANLIGSGPKVLESIDMVADDLAMYSGAGYCGKDGQRVPVGFGLPTARAGAISVGGRGA
ncbi:MAG: TldD/PmbA family protein [Polyangiaceae bacterium]|jgi:TldD protein|nr:TldD/PmbA family protein [Polyangiaceae bacterium]